MPEIAASVLYTKNGNVDLLRVDFNVMQNMCLPNCVCGLGSSNLDSFFLKRNSYYIKQISLHWVTCKGQEFFFGFLF